MTNTFMMRGIAVLSGVLFLALTACGNDEKRLDRAANAALAATMIDPTSFLTRNLRWGRDMAGNRAVCGEVNGKNRVGGYVGFIQFVAIGFEKPETAYVSLNAPIADGIPSDYPVIYQQYCELPSEKTARLEAEREAARLQKISDDADRMRRQREDAEARAQQEAVKRFATVYGTYTQSQDCEELRSKMIIDDKSISILAGPSFFNYINVSQLSGNKFEVTGYYAGSNSAPRPEKRKIEILSVAPRKIKIGTSKFTFCYD